MQNMTHMSSCTKENRDHLTGVPRFSSCYLSLVRQFALWDMNSNRLEENFTTWSYLCNSLYIPMNEGPHHCSICDDHFVLSDYASFLKY